MPGQSRKIHYKLIKATASEHVGKKGEVWYDADTTALRFYNGDPGGEVLSGGSSYSSNDYIDYGETYGGGNVVINLTKRYHWLVDLNSGNYYTLADGVDGQVLEFYTAFGLMYGGAENSNIRIDTCYHWSDAGASSRYMPGPREVRVFDHNATNQLRTKTTATWLNGGWHFDADVTDLGDWT